MQVSLSQNRLIDPNLEPVTFTRFSERSEVSSRRYIRQRIKGLSLQLLLLTTPKRSLSQVKAIT